MTPEEHKQIAKEAFKEAAKEWMQEIANRFTWWSFRTIGAALIVAIAYFILTMNGWSHIPETKTTPQQGIHR